MIRRVCVRKVAKNYFDALRVTLTLVPLLNRRHCLKSFMLATGPPFCPSSHFVSS